MGDNPLESYLSGLPPRDPAKAPAELRRYLARSAVGPRIMLGIAGAMTLAVGFGLAHASSSNPIGAVLFAAFLFFLPFALIVRGVRNKLMAALLQQPALRVQVVEVVDGVNPKNLPVLLTRLRSELDGTEFWVTSSRAAPPGLAPGTRAVALPVRLGALVVSGDTLVDARHIPLGRPVSAP